MSMKNNKNPNINKFFNKLYLFFPNIININQSPVFNDLKYVYVSNDSTIWFVKTENETQEIFLFGKIKENIPQPPLLNLSFDKSSNYSNNCSGIINPLNVYITSQYFIDNYPNFKTSLKKTNIDIFFDNNVNSIEVIELGDYIGNIENLIKNINNLLNELDLFKQTPKPENNKITTNKTTETCEICGKKLKNKKHTLCKKCSKKRHAADILTNLLKYVEPETPFTKKDLNQIYKKDIEINDCIWSLEEFNLIKRDYNQYYLENEDKLTKFIDKYYLVKEPVEEVKKEEPKKLNKTCSICKKTLPSSKFYKSKKTEDGFEDYCKNCKRYVNTANYLKDLINEVKPSSEFKVTDLTNNFKNPMEFIGRLWELQDFDLLTYDSDKDTYFLTDLKTCQNFLDEYYISGSVTIMPEIKKEDTTELTKEELMDNIIESVKAGKTDKEAAEIAGINLYQITHWFREGKNNSSKENIDFYNRYSEAKKEAKINSFKNFYVMESYNNKDELTIADTLRKQQMENVLKEIGSGSSMKTAAFNSSITYETLQYWYKRGKQNFGEEYEEFYEKINVLQSPIDIPKPEEKINQTTEETNEFNEKLPDSYKHILDPLPHKFKQIFRGSKESESGFAWVKKNRNSWRYDRQQKDNRQSASNPNIYGLYDEVIKHGFIWGVRDIEKAKKTLKQCEIPKVSSEVDEDIFSPILDPIAPEYANRFRKPSSSGLAWVNKINNTWTYANPKDNVRIYDNNIYNLYLKVKKENLPWGVRDLEKAKETIAHCEKPTIDSEIPKNINKTNSNITCAYFTNDKITKAIINGEINDDEVIKVINNFKEFEEKLIRIITTRHSKYTELFIEFNLEKTDLSKFKELINQLNMDSMKETNPNDKKNTITEYNEEYPSLTQNSK